MPAWKRAILSKQRERSRSQLQRKATHYYDRDGRKVALPAQNDDDDDDDDDDRRRGGKKGRKHKSEKDKRKGKGSKDSSDQRKRRDDQKGRKKSTADKKKKGPTNVDDFDEDDSSSTETSSSDSSSSDSEESTQKNLTSEEAMKMLGTKWALGGEDDIEDLDERIKTQQVEIQRELSKLTQLQRSSGMKALPSLQQKVLQSDLQKLQAIQGKLKENPGVRELQMLLVGHQMLLCEHVKEIQESLTQFQQPPPANDNGLHIPDELKPRMSPATSASHLPLPTNAPPPPAPAPAPAPPPSAPAPPPPPAPAQVNVPPPYNNPMLALAEQSQVNQMLQTELLMAAEQARRQQLTQQLLAQRRQQQLMAAAQLSSAGFGGMGMSAFSPLTPSFPLL